MRLFLSAIAAVALAACHHTVAAPLIPAGRVLPAPIPPLTGEEQIGVALKYIDRTLGAGAPVVERQCVYVHYTGWLTDGTKFDSSRDTTSAGQPRTPIGFPFGFGSVIAGWDQGFDFTGSDGNSRWARPAAGLILTSQTEFAFDPASSLAVSATTSRKVSLCASTGEASAETPRHRPKTTVASRLQMRRLPESFLPRAIVKAM